MSKFQIAILNRSTVLSDDAVASIVPVLQKQVSNDFAPAWGIDADLFFVDSNSQPSQGQWWLAILDNNDQAGALGYHDLTDEGLPMGKVFAKTDQTYKQLWTVTASHELLEMLADPDINLCALDQSSPFLGRLYAYEVCDACESDQFAYEIDGIAVSDFVHPTWFESLWKNAASKPQFDHANILTEPFSLAKGGYISVLDFGTVRGWVQVFGEHHPSALSRAHIGSRRERRHTPRAQWIKSLFPAEEKSPRQC